MKIRSGFVSNSSSSSFILDFGGTPSVERIEKFISQFGSFEDLHYSAQCFLNEMSLITVENIQKELEEIEDDIKCCKSKDSWYDYCLSRKKECEKTLKNLQNKTTPIYEIWISDHRDEDPWAIINVKHKVTETGEEWLDYDSLESTMCSERFGIPEIIGYKNGH